MFKKTEFIIECECLPQATLPPAFPVVLLSS